MCEVEFWEVFLSKERTHCRYALKIAVAMRSDNTRRATGPDTRLEACGYTYPRLPRQYQSLDPIEA
jgi:hypothetical protein